jgi:hypothetical protein
MLSENWFSDRWADIKAVTGIGSDSLGLGKNTEKGWKPRYGKSQAPAPKKPVRRRPPGEGDTRTWEIG